MSLVMTEWLARMYADGRFDSCLSFGKLRAERGTEMKENAPDIQQIPDNKENGNCLKIDSGVLLVARSREKQRLIA